MAEEKRLVGSVFNPVEKDVLPSEASELRILRVRKIVPRPPAKAQTRMKEEFRQRFFKESERHVVFSKLSKRERAAVKLGGRAAGIALEKKRGPLTGKMVADVVLAFVTQFVVVRERIVDDKQPQDEVSRDASSDAQSGIGGPSMPAIIPQDDPETPDAVVH